MTITSKDNDKLKEARRLARRSGRDKSERFVAEGEDLLAAADAAGRAPVFRLAAAGSGLAGEEVDPDLLADASALGSGTRTLAVYEQRWTEPAGPVCVYLHGVGDPGNIGTILRSALAFGAGSVVLGPDCADPYSPKAVRASMGAIFTVPVARVASPAGLPGQSIALVAGEGEPLASVAHEGSHVVAYDRELVTVGDDEVTILVGAEREGLPREIVNAADRVARIPIASESLNAAMAATVALYELTRGGDFEDATNRIEP